MLNLWLMKAKDKQQDELLELGKKLQNFYEMGYVDKRSAFTFTFLKGIVQGIGVFIGGTVVIGLLLWVLSGLEQVPLVKPVRDALQNPTQQQ